MQIGTGRQSTSTPMPTKIQYVVDGTGTEWLGDKQVALKPGIMLLIPHDTPHGGIDRDERPHENDRDPDAAARARRHQTASVTAA